MKHIKKAVVGLMAALALLLGGMIAAAPAQAIAGTEVYLAQATPDSGWVKVTNTNGWEKIIHEGETANNAVTACPPGSNWQLVVSGPSGTTRWMDPGQCYRFTKATSAGSPYLLSVVHAI